MTLGAACQILPRPSERPRESSLTALAAALLLVTMVLPARAQSPRQEEAGRLRQKHAAVHHASRKPEEHTRPSKATTIGPLPFVPPILTTLPDGLRFSLDTKGLTIKAPDDTISFRIGGRLHLDGSAASLRPGSLGPALEDDVRIRRAWLEAYLTLYDRVEAAFQYDFGSATQPINDAALAYRGAEPFIVTIGNFKEPFSLDQLISNNNTLFVERSLLDTFAPARDFGAALGAHGDRWTAVAGVFGGNANTGIAQNGVAGTARLTYAPILTSDQVLHLGVAGSYRALDTRGTALSFSSTPEDDLFASPLVDTGTLRNAGDVGRLGLELLYQSGPYRVQAEYALTHVGGIAGQTDRTFQAGYVQAAWVINGHGPAYKLVPDYGTTYAVLGGVEVADGQRISQGGIGVFELGARFSAISLQSADTRGGTQRDVSAGLNWYPDRNVKVMADYVHGDADPAAASLTGRPASTDLFVGRLQFYW